MVKIMNIVFGVGIAVIVFIIALLGIQAFYPQPEYGKFCNSSTIYAQPTQYTVYDCQDNLTVLECKKFLNDKQINSPVTKAQDAEQQRCSTAYDTASKNYNKTFFLIASILGLIMIIVSFFLLNIINISAGVASAGIVLIIVAFSKGWSNTNDVLKFVVGLVIGAVVVFLTLKINKRFSDKEETNMIKESKTKVKRKRK
jgi:hypothetical protein